MKKRRVILTVRMALLISATELEPLETFDTEDFHQKEVKLNEYRYKSRKSGGKRNDR